MTLKELLERLSPLLELVQDAVLALGPKVPSEVSARILSNLATAQKEIISLLTTGEGPVEHDDSFLS